MDAGVRSRSRSRSPRPSPAGAILVDRDLAAALGDLVRPAPGARPLDRALVQPASLDLRLGPAAHRIRAGFLPQRVPVEERLRELEATRLPLDGDGSVLERGLVYLVPLEEELHLPPDVQARFNPRSSTGRCDVFTRVLVPGHPRFDEAPPGYRGPLWLEVAPLSFPVRLRRGDRLCQLRLQRGRPALEADELRAAHAESPVGFDGDRPLAAGELAIDQEGCLSLRVGLEGRDPCAWRAALHTGVLDFSGAGAHDRGDFWQPVHARDGHCVLEPGRFYLFASRERISIPPHLAAEMLPVDVGIGELRNNYAGFFDSGFGWSGSRPGGTPAVLEVRAHDVPFLVEDGQVLFRLRFFHTNGEPDRLYGEGEGPSYASQDLTLARPFR